VHTTRAVWRITREDGDAAAALRDLAGWRPAGRLALEGLLEMSPAASEPLRPQIQDRIASDRRSIELSSYHAWVEEDWRFAELRRAIAAC